MATFVMLGKMSGESVKQISAQRSVDAQALIKKHGGELKSGFILLGQYDLILTVEVPSVEHIVKISIGLSRLLGFTFITAQAIEVDTLDKLVAEI